MAQRVAGEGFAQLGHGAQVPGVQFRNLDGLPALHHAQMGEPLLAAPGVVLQGGVVLDHPADDFEKGDAPGEGIGHGLEDHQGCRSAVGYLAEGLGIIGGLGLVCAGRYGFNRRVPDGKGGALDGRGGVNLDEIEKMVGSHVGQTTGKQYREDAVVANGFVERGDEMLLGDGARIEVHFHQLVLALGHQLDQRFMP